MPYIKQELRERMEPQFAKPQTPGELNFQITRLIQGYLPIDGSLSYQDINDIIGALEGAKLEFYARVARPYEDEKIKQNGDCY